jgi:hypothetical protein
MSKSTNKLLPAVMLTVAAVQSVAAAVPADTRSVTETAGATPVLMQFAQKTSGYAEPESLVLFSRSLVERLDVAMMPVGCDGDYDCYKTQCGTGTFCAGAGVDDTDEAC